MKQNNINLTRKLFSRLKFMQNTAIFGNVFWHDYSENYGSSHGSTQILISLIYYVWGMTRFRTSERREMHWIDQNHKNMSYQISKKVGEKFAICINFIKSLRLNTHSRILDTVLSFLNYNFINASITFFLLLYISGFRTVLKFD
jgi:hypothetical protein